MPNPLQEDLFRMVEGFIKQPLSTFDNKSLEETFLEQIGFILSDSSYDSTLLLSSEGSLCTFILKKCNNSRPENDHSNQKLRELLDLFHEKLSPADWFAFITYNILENIAHFVAMAPLPLTIGTLVTLFQQASTLNKDEVEQFISSMNHLKFSNSTKIFLNAQTNELRGSLIIECILMTQNIKIVKEMIQSQIKQPEFFMELLKINVLQRFKQHLEFLDLAYSKTFFQTEFNELKFGEMNLLEGSKHFRKPEIEIFLRNNCHVIESQNSSVTTQTIVNKASSSLMNTRNRLSKKLIIKQVSETKSSINVTIEEDLQNKLNALSVCLDGVEIEPILKKVLNADFASLKKEIEQYQGSKKTDLLNYFTILEDRKKEFIQKGDYFKFKPVESKKPPKSGKKSLNPLQTVIPAVIPENKTPVEQSPKDKALLAEIKQVESEKQINLTPEGLGKKLDELSEHLDKLSVKEKTINKAFNSINTAVGQNQWLQNPEFEPLLKRLEGLEARRKTFIRNKSGYLEQPVPRKKNKKQQKKPLNITEESTQTLGSVDNCPTTPNSPTLHGLTGRSLGESLRESLGESLNPADKPQDVGFEINSQQSPKESELSHNPVTQTENSDLQNTDNLEPKVSVVPESGMIVETCIVEGENSSQNQEPTSIADKVENHPQNQESKSELVVFKNEDEIVPSPNSDAPVGPSDEDNQFISEIEINSMGINPDPEACENTEENPFIKLNRIYFKMMKIELSKFVFKITQQLSQIPGSRLNLYLKSKHIQQLESAITSINHVSNLIEGQFLRYCPQVTVSEEETEASMVNEFKTLWENLFPNEIPVPCISKIDEATQKNHADLAYKIGIKFNNFQVWNHFVTSHLETIAVIKSYNDNNQQEDTVFLVTFLERFHSTLRHYFLLERYKTPKEYEIHDTFSQIINLWKTSTPWIICNNTYEIGTQVLSYILNMPRSDTDFFTEVNLISPEQFILLQVLLKNFILFIYTQHPQWFSSSPREAFVNSNQTSIHWELHLNGHKIDWLLSTKSFEETMGERMLPLATLRYRLDSGTIINTVDSFKPEELISLDYFIYNQAVKYTIENINPEFYTANKIAFLMKVIAKISTIFSNDAYDPTVISHLLTTSARTLVDEAPRKNALTILFGKDSLLLSGFHEMILNYHLEFIFGLDKAKDEEFLLEVRECFNRKSFRKADWSKVDEKNITPTEYVGLMLFRFLWNTMQANALVTDPTQRKSQAQIHDLVLDKASKCLNNRDIRGVPVQSPTGEELDKQACSLAFNIYSYVTNRSSNIPSICYHFDVLNFKSTRRSSPPAAAAPEQAVPPDTMSYANRLGFLAKNQSAQPQTPRVLGNPAETVVINPGASTYSHFRRARHPQLPAESKSFNLTEG